MKIYLVGGAVRDFLLNRPHREKDWVVVGSSPEEMLEKGFRPVGKDFPVFLHPETHEEYALARTERKSAKGYKGFVFHTSKEVTLEEDLRRRDLTINAMAMTDDGEIIDPYGGREDLESGILRHVSGAFVEDPVRLLRIAKFMARFVDRQFTIAKETLELMKEMVLNGEVDALVSDRVWQEFDSALSENEPREFFHVLEQCGALIKLFPEIKTHLNKLTLVSDEDKEVRFAQLLLPLAELEIKSLVKRYPVPVHYRELALLSNKFQKLFSQSNISAEMLFEIINGSDAWRKKDRFEKLLSVFKTSSLISIIKNAYEETSHVSAKSFLEQGFTGSALGEEIAKERLRLIELIKRKHF